MVPRSHLHTGIQRRMPGGAARRSHLGLAAAVLTAGWILAAGLSSPAAAQIDAAQATPLSPDMAPRQLDADTKFATPSGATFEAAKGWFVSTPGGTTVLQDPDRELTLTMLEMKGADGAGVIAAAWKQVQPGFSREIRQTMNPPARQGWDEIVRTVYVTATEERRTVLAIARRKADTWYVSLIDGTDAALDRRGAQMQTAVTSFKASGVEKESFAGRTPHPLDAERQKAFADFIEQARIDGDIPGAAVAVIQDGKVVFERGFGAREQGRPDPVTPNTLFLIGSTSKSLTTFMMARLVDAGKVSWESPVTQLYPGFALGDADVTKQLLLKHTVCACTGLPRQDMEFLFEYADDTPERIVASMRDMKPTTGFGETFQYSNTMVATGGYVAAHAARPGEALGPAYDHTMQELVLDPLGMTATTFDFARAEAADHASPHGKDLHEKTAPFPLAYERAVIPVRPAGGAWSSARDMIRWVQVELSKGIGPDGKRIVSEENLLRRREPQVKVTDELSYGLGLFVGKDRDVAIVHHGGNTLGFTSDTFFFPDYGIGAVVLTNAGQANEFRSAVRRRLLEILFDGRDEAKESLAFSLSQRRTLMEKVIGETDFTPERSWLESLVGAYDNPSLGHVDVRLDETGGATFDAGEWKSPLARWRGPDGVAQVILTGAPFAGLGFLPGEKDGRPTLNLELSQQRYVFERTR